MQSRNNETTAHSDYPDTISFFRNVNAARGIFLSLQDVGQLKLEHGNLEEAEYDRADCCLGLGIAGLAMLDQVIESVVELQKQYESMISERDKAIDRAELAMEHYHKSTPPPRERSSA